MKKSAAIFHGLGCSEQSFWIPWLKASLQAEGFEVWTPCLPDCERFDDLELWVNDVVAKSSQRHYDLMVGHSAGGSLILRLLSRHDFSADHIVSVAGFIKPSVDMKDNPAVPDAFNIKQIKNNCRAFTFIHADDDPWDCDDKQGEFMRQHLGGTLIIKTGDGHFGSGYYQQPYKTFPMLLAHCLFENTQQNKSESCE